MSYKNFTPFEIESPQTKDGGIRWSKGVYGTILLFMVVSALCIIVVITLINHFSHQRTMERLERSLEHLGDVVARIKYDLQSVERVQGNKSATVRYDFACICDMKVLSKIDI